METVFLKISENSRESTCAGAVLQLAILLKKRLRHRYFPVFEIFKNTYFVEHDKWQMAASKSKS